MLWPVMMIAPVACQDSEQASEQSTAESAVADALSADALCIDALSAPRDDNPLIAGEEVRIGVRIRGGTPPYSGRVTAERQGTSPAEDAPIPIDARLALDPDAAGADAIELATSATLDARALSGIYRLRASIVDARGRRTSVYSDDFRLIGDDAERVPAHGVAGPWVRVVDVAGRARKTFVRGESVVVQVSLPGETRVALEVRAPNGRSLAQSTLPLPDSGPRAHRLGFPLAIPRLAATGEHIILARGAAGTEASGVIEVASAPLPPVSALVIDAVHLYGGRDSRARRAGVLWRGEDLLVEARVGGARRSVSVALRLSGHLGVADKRELGHEPVSDPGPRARLYVRGTWRVPERIPPGRYQLLLEAMEGDHVSLRARDILIR